MRRIIHLAVDTTIKNNILNLLQGYITISDKDNDNTITEMDYDNILTDEELELFYAQGLKSSLNYCYLVNFPTQTIIENGEPVVVMDSLFQYGVILYTAGMIWRKYDIRANDQIEEGGYSISYGDQLIIDAKKQLEPFIFRAVSFW